MRPLTAAPTVDYGRFDRTDAQRFQDSNPQLALAAQQRSQAAPQPEPFITWAEASTEQRFAYLNRHVLATLHRLGVLEQQIRCMAEHGHTSDGKIVLPPFRTPDPVSFIVVRA